MKRAIRFMKENPGRELRLLFNKLFFFFVVDLNHPLSRKPIYWTWYFIFVWPFVIYALWTGGRGWLGERSILIVPVLIQAFVTAFFFFLPRYRLLIDPFLFMIAGAGISIVVGRFKITASADVGE